MLLDDLISYETFEDFDPYVFGGCTFKRDFGPWRKGDRADVMLLDFEKGVARSVDKDGAVIVEVLFTITPVAIREAKVATCGAPHTCEQGCSMKCDEPVGHAGKHSSGHLRW